MNHLVNKLCSNNHRDCLSSTHLNNALDDIHKGFVVVLIDNATGNIVFVFKRFYAFFITRELGLKNNSSTDTYNNAGGFCANNVIDKSIRYLKIKFGTDSIPVENHQLHNMYLKPKMQKNLLKLGSLKHLLNLL